MAARIDIEALGRRASEALGRLPWFDIRNVPRAYHNPQGYAEWLRIAASDLPSDLVRSRDFLEARAAVDELVAAEELRATALELYNHPAINEVCGSEANKQWLWEHPDEAFKLFSRHANANPREYRDSSSPLGRALGAISSAVAWDADHEGSGPAPEQAPSAPEAARSEAARAGRVEQTPVPGPKPNGVERSPPSRLAGMRGSATPKPTPAQVNAEWARAVAAYERTHPEDDDLLGGENRYPPDQGRETTKDE